MNRALKYTLIAFAVIVLLAAAFVFFVVFISEPGDSFFPVPPDLPAAEEQTT